MFTWHPDGRFGKIFQACQGPTSFIAYERGCVIFEYSHVFRSGGSLMVRSQPKEARDIFPSHALERGYLPSLGIAQTPLCDQLISVTKRSKLPKLSSTGASFHHIGSLHYGLSDCDFSHKILGITKRDSFGVALKQAACYPVHKGISVLRLLQIYGKHSKVTCPRSM
jgi:hypothetical protein